MSESHCHDPDPNRRPGNQFANAPSPPPSASSQALPPASPLAWFDDMIEHCLEYARLSRAAGHPIVGILCEYAPRELILAAGGVPVCLCGGSAKTIPAAETDLPANLCPLIKSTYGYHALKSNPFLEMADLIIAETTCDGKKKMFELMGLSRPHYVLELSQKENDRFALAHWICELRKLRATLESRFSVAISDAKIRSAIVLMNRERALRRALAQLMKADDPPFTGRQLLEFKSSISCIPADLARYEQALIMFGGNASLPQNYCEGIRVQTGDASSACGKGGESATPPGPRGLADSIVSPLNEPKTGCVRVLLTGVPMVHGAERVIEIIEARGGLVVCQENCTGLKPILEDVDATAADPIRALAEKYFRIPCSVKTPNDRRLASLRALAAEYRAECVIDLVWQACLTYAVESARVKRLAEQELNLPYLRIETDYSSADSARLEVRVEALFETVRARQISVTLWKAPLPGNIDSKKLDGSHGPF